MSLRKFVKLSSVTNLSDARYGSGMGVDLIGFSINPADPNFTSPEKFTEIKNWIPGPGIVGEYDGNSLAELNNLALNYELDYLEVNRPEFLTNLSLQEVPLIINLDCSNYETKDNLEEDILFCSDMVSYIIITNHSESPIKFEDVLQLSGRYRIIVGFNITPSTIKDQILASDLLGITIKGGTEEKVGYKDYDELANILEAIEVD